MAEDCVLLVGHGSRVDAANNEFQALASAYRAARPELRVETCYIELAQPLLADALTTLASEVERLIVIPVFLFAAGHVKNDVPLAVADTRRRFPRNTIAVAPALGVHPSLIELARARADVLARQTPQEQESTTLLVVGRGSSDPDANGDFCKVVRLITEGRGSLHVESAFIAITKPSVEIALERIARLRPHRLVVLPYLLFAGRLVEQLSRQIAEFAARHPWIHAEVTPHLGLDDRLVALVDERVDQASTGDALLACDNCHYRRALPGLPDEVGGLRALLYSVRHPLTHP